jgi:dienelactone hydrolase
VFVADVRGRMEAMLMDFSVGYRALWTLLLIAAMSGAASAQGQAGAPGPEQVTLQSATYADFRQLQSRDAAAKAIAVAATLSFPETVRERYPAVVVVHSIAGAIEANEGAYAAELRKAGFATLLYDSFAARGTTGIALARSGPGLWPSGVADAYAALRLLAADPRIDAAHIAIVGFSYGGEVAHLAAFERLRAALDPGSARFAAHVAYYPAGVFGAAAAPDAYTGSPILMLLGKSDDNLPVEKVEAYLDYAKAAGNPAPVQTVIYPGAYHAWTVPSLTTLRFYAEYPSTKQCPFILLGSERPSLLVDGKLAPFDPAVMADCIGKAPGYSMAFDAAVRAKSSAESIGFLKRHLLLP